MAKLVFDIQTPFKLKNSLFCGFKGFFICNLAAITMLESSLHMIYIRGSRRNTVKQVRAHARYQLKNHIVPFLEVVVVMPLFFILTHFLGDRVFGGFSPTEKYLACLIVCMLVMILICLSLRLLGQRKDPCCGVIRHPIYRSDNKNNNDYIRFRGPNYHTGTSNEPQELSNGLRILLSVVISVLLTPFFLLKAAIELACAAVEVLELPISFLFDLCNLLQDTVTSRTGYHVVRGPKSADRFTHCRKTLNTLSSFLYAGFRDLIVACSLGILNAHIIENHENEHVTPISMLDDAFIGICVFPTTSRT
ncbi:hypothetical protein [Ehrlichia canis]|uniref:Uncharacterized protein n=1 Tax=Ehrlichia canis (strain Jake) TaxID=269484 RepID=A0ACA6AW44_EHRCJ|nr:hypothetical protein [Ehrlichia canis]AAZ68656.1 hypothetical protein Ecaj_0622 [Ehrlichia canis str. Jake]